MVLLGHHISARKRRRYDGCQHQHTVSQHKWSLCESNVRILTEELRRKHALSYFTKLQITNGTTSEIREFVNMIGLKQLMY